MTLFGIATIASMGMIVSIYMLGAISFAIVTMVESEFKVDLRVPEWFSLFCYCLFSPLIITLSAIGGKKDLNEQSVGLHQRAVGAETGRGAGEVRD